MNTLNLSEFEFQGLCPKMNERDREMTKRKKKPYTVDDFLEEENIEEEVNVVAIKRVIAWQVQEAMEHQHISKKTMAERMHTSRSQLDRLLDPAYTGITLDLLAKAAKAVGRELKLELT